MSRPVTEGWERWPAHNDLMTGQPLCRWCHAPLDGRKTSWCSKACESQVVNRCHWDAARRVLAQRQRGVCQRCGLDTEALRAALRFYESVWRERGWLLSEKFAGLSVVEKNKMRALTAHWPEVKDVCRAIGKAALYSRFPGELWDANHIVAIAEGGSLCDQENLETLCLACHADHTAALKARLAKIERVRAKHDGDA